MFCRGRWHGVTSDSCLFSQYDPEDQPSVVSLNPDYFDFDREQDQHDINFPV